jgi:hypothetical protein
MAEQGNKSEEQGEKSTIKESNHRNWESAAA